MFQNTLNPPKSPCSNSRTIKMFQKYISFDLVIKIPVIIER